MNFIISLYASLIELVSSLNYFGILFGMILESSFFPFPSEVILIPAGTLASQGKFSFILVFIFAVFGSLIGALINYSLALFFGRYSIEFMLNSRKRFLFIRKKNLTKADKYFNKHGEITTFVGRLIPIIRQLISIPAGFARMNLTKFLFYTAFGSGIWSLILISLGYFIGENSELIQNNLSILTLNIILLSLITIIFYIIKRIKKTSH